MKKNIRISSLAVVVSFLTIIALGMILIIVLPDREVSYDERRYLADFPEITLDAILDSEYSGELDLYLTDQFPFREFFRKSKAIIGALLGSTDNNGYILDGMPRTIPQAEALLEQGIEIDRVVSIEIADEVIESRMTGRRVCGSCGASYHIVANPPKTEGICNACGSELVIRKDDKPETVRQRLEVYHAETEALKGFYEKLGKLRLVQGDQPIGDATRDILAALGVEA